MIWLPRTRTRTEMRFSFTLLGIFFMFLGHYQFSYNQFEGLALLSIGGLLFLIGVVYLAEWFENLTYSMRIIQSIVFATLVAGIFGFFVFGPWKSFATALFVGFAAEVAGTFGGIYFYIKEHREENRDSLPSSEAHKKRMIRN